VAEERSDAEGARQQPQDNDESQSATKTVASNAEAEGRKLMGGRKINFFGGPLPVRSLAAIAVFIAVFVVVWLLLWAVLGSIGLIFGWLIAALVGLVAVKLFADRMAMGARPE